jgi:hypothetical protein
MGSDAEAEAIAGRINYSNRQMTIASLAPDDGFTDLDVSQLEARRYLVEAETDNFADVAERR